VPTPETISPRRALLVNGERLRQRIDPPKRGYGEGFTPYGLDETIDRLAPQIRDLSGDLQGISEDRRGENLIVEATLVPQYLSASAFPGKLFASSGLVPVGTRPGLAPSRNKKGDVKAAVPTKTIFLALESDDLEALQRVVENPKARGLANQVADDVLAIQSLALPAAEVALPEGDVGNGQVLWESVLHPQLGRRGLPSPASEITISRYVAYVESLNGTCDTDWIRTSDAVTFVPVRLPVESVEALSMFNGLRAVHPMPGFRDLPLSEARDDIPQLASPSQSAPAPADALRVAVFDGGVDDTSPYWHDRVRNLIVGTINPHSVFSQHGALVTSSLLYGHLDSPTLPDHYETVPQAGQALDYGMYWLLDVIERQLNDDATDYDVVTICVAPQKFISDHTIDRWTSTLDRLAYEREVLFVVAAGNNGDAITSFNRILVPADAANVLGVGAASTTARPSERASYSPVGPGRPGAEIRPTGLAFGGATTEPFIAVDNDGTALHFIGTSCAAPLVTNSLADLATRIGRARLTPEAMRAFAIHFAEPCKKGSLLTEAGHGHFRGDYEFLENTPPNEAHVLYRGTIARNELVSLPLPVPDGHTGSLKVSFTLVTTTAINADDTVDYTKAGLETKFRPHAHRYLFKKEGQKDQRVDTQAEPDRARRLLTDGYQPSSEPLTDSIMTRLKDSDHSEAALRQEGKWDSVRVGAHRYIHAQKSLYRPRLDISHLAREGGTLAYNTDDLDWALLVSLTATRGIPLYDQVRSQYEVLTVLPSSSVRVRAGT
jgi:hypothetical protein